MTQHTGDSAEHIKKPLVSVIISCYNQGRYLGKAIQSVKEQTYKNIEIIVINDGSTDETAEILKSAEGIKCISQENQGLPNARNRGISESSGEYLAFLDSDDWFYPEAIEHNLQWLIKNPSLAFVSGGHTRINEKGETWVDRVEQIDKDHYTALLRRNYIGNPATVLYTKWILDLIPYDNSISIKGCEDYDHYLKITRSYPVAHHHLKISVYRKHPENMSDNYPMMLESVLNTLKRQEKLLKNNAQKLSLEQGIKEWKSMYLNWIYELILTNGIKNIPGGTKEFFWKFKGDFISLLGRKITIRLHTFLINLKK